MQISGYFFNSCYLFSQGLFIGDLKILRQQDIEIATGV